MTLTDLRGPLAAGDGLVVIDAGRLDPVLAEFAWLIDASQNPTGMTDQIGALVATHAAPQPRNPGPSLFPDQALVGQMTLTGGTNTGDWFTDLDFRWRAGLAPHDTADFAGGHNNWQIMFIPATDTSIAWLEINFKPQEDGTVLIFLDAGGDGNAGADRFSWTSTIPVGDWRDGIPIRDYRLTVEGGDATVYIDDDLHETDPGAISGTFNEPPDAQTVWARGSSSGPLVPVVSFELLDGLDGDPIITFDAASPAGWAQDLTAGTPASPTGAPTRRAYFGATPPWLFAPAPVFDLPANADRCILLAYRPIQLDTAFWFQRNIQGIFGGQPGWGFTRYTPGPGIPYAFVIGSGGAPVVAALGDLGDGADHLVIVNIDRAGDLLAAYVDGDQVAEVDISAIGAVSPNEPVTPGLGTCWLYAAGIAHRILPEDEIEHLTDLLI